MTDSEPASIPAGPADAGLVRVVLLAGRVGPSELAVGVRRSTLDLPVTTGRSLLDTWTDRLEELACAKGKSRLDVVVALGRDCESPRVPAAQSGRRVHIEFVRDASEYRGTAGVVRDLTSDIAESARVVVVVAQMIHVEPLAASLSALWDSGEGICVITDGVSDSVGAYILSRKRLLGVPEVGFVDLKEQAIPETSDAGSLPVVRRPIGAAWPVRTRAEYIRALRAIHGEAFASADASSQASPLGEHWRPRFVIVEPGAAVAEGAVVQDSVVLSGGRVESGAVVARSVVCPGGVVRRGECAVETIVGS